jgi:hypothetical protein
MHNEQASTCREEYFVIKSEYPLVPLKLDAASF